MPTDDTLGGEPVSLQQAKGPGRVRRLINRLRRALRSPKHKWIMVILNPASGQATPDLRTMNRVIHGAGYQWEIGVTNEWGDGARLALEAQERGASIVAAYGGDGTVMDVASGMLHSQTPLAILPGGTGNALAKDLWIPLDLAAACALMVDPKACTRQIDLGVTNEKLFLLRTGLGLEADIVMTADRAMKDRYGLLAYAAATLQAWNQPTISHYRLEMDGQVVEIDGLACMVANAASLGIPGVNISPKVRIDDGLLDVLVIRRADLGELASMAASVIGTSGTAISGLPNWQCREVSITADPPQGIEADGEHLGTTPARVSLIPGAIKVIAPAA